MLKDKALKEYAKKLVQLSFDNGQISDERVAAILETLKTSCKYKVASVLKQYAFYLRREIKKSQIHIEYAGALNAASVDSLTENLSKAYKRPLSAVTEENKELIAGLRVYIGDDVYDSSVAGRLESLKVKTA